MSNVNETPTWEDGVYQIETTDPVLGGPGGIANVQAGQLANRTAYLKERADQVDAIAAQLGAPLPETLAAIVKQIGGIGDALNGLASPASVQNAVDLDWLYRNQRIVFELFAVGYELRNLPDIKVVSGLLGDDSLDIETTAGVKPGYDYLLFDDDAGGGEGAETALVRVASVLSGARVRLTADLQREWGPTAILTGSTLVARPEGGVTATIGAQWVSRAVHLGSDSASRAVVIRRTLNSGEVRLFFRDTHTHEWTERPWSVCRAGSGTTDIPEGFADYEYTIPMRGEGFLRLVVEGEPMVIKHLVALGIETGLGGLVNPQLRPDAPVIISPAIGAVNVIESPTLAVGTGKGFDTVRYQISVGADFSVLTHETGELPGAAYVVPAGILTTDTTYYVRASVTDENGLISEWSSVGYFTTQAVYVYIHTPTITAPSDGQTGLFDPVTLESSAFGFAGDSDTHVSSQWQIRLAFASWDDPPLHDSGADPDALTRYTIPGGILSSGEIRHVARVRHTGALLGTSAWSTDVAFVTERSTVLSDMELSSDEGANLYLKVGESDAKTGLRTERRHYFPTASAQQIGLMPAADVVALNGLAVAVELLSGRAVRYPVHLDGIEVAQENLQSAYEAASGNEGPPPDGTTLIDLDEDISYTWYESSASWVKRGSDSVNMATNGVLGTVKGDAETPGKIYVENDGSMSVIGWDVLSNRVVIYSAASESAALAYSSGHPGVLVIYPEI